MSDFFDATDGEHRQRQELLRDLAAYEQRTTYRPSAGSVIVGGLISFAVIALVWAVGRG